MNLTPERTMTTTQTCTDCYDDPCTCRDHEYVLLVSLDEEGAPWTAEQAQRVEELLADAGWTVEIRSPRRGEAEATYRRKAEGTLQILGYSLPVPAALAEAIRTAGDTVIQ